MKRTTMGGIVAVLGGGLFGVVGTYFGMTIWQVIIMEVIALSTAYGAEIIGSSKRMASPVLADSQDFVEIKG